MNSEYEEMVKMISLARNMQDMIKSLLYVQTKTYAR